MYTQDDEEIIKFINDSEKQTTHLNDFKWPVVVPEYSAPIKEPRISRKKRKNVDGGFNNITHIPRDVNVPFNMTIRTNPINAEFTSPIPALEGEEETDAKSIKQFHSDRPRIYKCPEVSLDDIPDLELRSKIMNFMYTSEVKNAYKSDTCTTNYSKKLAGENVRMKENSLSLRGQLEVPSSKVIPKDWTEADLRKAERNQPRFVGEPTRTFWLQKNVHGSDYDPTAVIVPKDYEDNIIKLVKEDKLRLPHTQYHHTYGGYKPRSPQNIPLEKQPNPPTGFWFTTNQYYGYHSLKENQYKEDCN